MSPDATSKLVEYMQNSFDVEKEIRYLDTQTNLDTYRDFYQFIQRLTVNKIDGQRLVN